MVFFRLSYLHIPRTCTGILLDGRCIFSLLVIIVSLLYLDVSFSVGHLFFPFCFRAGVYGVS
ncbi:hypothetical protein BJ508DRAFT_1948 [Ascobolus immersus RN42]|uniref:Uncharacterized protein n=1 Tax=Ascobolus immersus RN42 TaxID=1160509 RepID=A0A3N4IPC5_ASCIM|nr:hypothetical protein BJ508DRAFT_1948 [Ascobolus immersus RN42]